MIATRFEISSISARTWLDSSTVMPCAGEPADQVAHVADARRVEAGLRLVEDEQARVADQGRGDAEPLAHAVRVAADAMAGAIRQLDRLERRVDAVGRVAAVVGRAQLEVAARRAGTGRSAAPRRSPATPSSAAGPSAMGSRPNSVATPAVGRIRPSSIRSVVVLPAPFGPRKP